MVILIFMSQRSMITVPPRYMPRPRLERDQLTKILDEKLRHHHAHCLSIAESTERITEKIYEMAQALTKRKVGKTGWASWKKRRAEDQTVPCPI